MVSDDLICSDELVKGSVHLAVGTLCGVACVYNLGVFAVKPSRRHGVQTVLYGLGMFVEFWQTFSHWSCARRTREVVE